MTQVQYAEPTPECPCCGQAIPPHASFRFDAVAGEASGNGLAVQLTRQQAALLGALLEVSPRVLSREFLLERTCIDMTGDDDRVEKTVDVIVVRVRRSIAPLGCRIETVWGRGFRAVVTKEKAHG